MFQDTRIQKGSWFMQRPSAAAAERLNAPVFQHPPLRKSKQAEELSVYPSLISGLRVWAQPPWKRSPCSPHLELMSDGVLGLVAAAGARGAVYPHRWHVTTQERLCTAACDRRTPLPQGHMSVKGSRRLGRIKYSRWVKGWRRQEVAG